MADDIDKAQELNEQHLEQSLKKIKIGSPVFSGFCLNCAEPIGAKRYCDRECREEHERRQKSHRG